MTRSMTSIWGQQLVHLGHGENRNHRAQHPNPHLSQRAPASSETRLLESAINSSAYQRLFLEQDLTLTMQSLVINVTFDQ